MRPIYASMLALSISSPAFAAAHIFGGMCASQGTWLQSALTQNQLIVDAITALKDDPDCKVLTNALAQLPKASVNAKGAAQGDNDDLATSFREISALDDYMAPDKFKNLSDAMTAHGQDPKKFQDAMFNVVFNKSYEKLKDLSTSIDLVKDSDATRKSQGSVSPRLKNYIDESEEIANVAMASSQVIMRAIPQSQTCLHRNPGVAATIVGALAQTGASMITGGKVNGVGEFIGSVLTFSRDMSYMKSLKGLEMERFKNSVSCLIESTSENYCATQDAEAALEALKLNGDDAPKTLQQMLSVSAKDPVASPVAGLVIYMRDIPVVQEWLQRVLYGMSPRQSWQGMGKNDNWSAYLSFIQSVNSLQANFSDKEQLYYQDAKTADVSTKMGRVREIFNDTLDVVRGRDNQSSVNFYTRAMQREMIPFYLLGINLPNDFNLQTNNIETMWLKWSREGSNGFDNPDHLLQAIKENLWKLMDKAQGQANQLFAQRMVVDPLNLITAGMRGPGVSAYQAFLDQRTYYRNLITKLQTSVVEMQADSSQNTRRQLLASHIPLLQDSVKRLDQVITALESVGKVNSSSDTSTSTQSEAIMNVIYNAANMLVSWDNFFGLRMQTALQADLSDTLWRKSSLSESQRQYFLAVGPELVSKLSGFYSTDPVSQRTDLSAAKVAQVANLKAVEEQFAAVLFNEILDIDCKLEGGYACDARSLGQSFNPAGGFIERNKISTLNGDLASYRGGKTFGRLLKWMYPQTDDSKALIQVKAKYCVQALAFDSRDMFSEICKGAVMESDLTDSHDSLGLNADFDTQLSSVKQVTASAAAGHIDRARSAGVCALRGYLRKNHVYYMYRDYNSNE